MKSEEHRLAEFHQSLTRINATAMVVGTIIGAAIFVQPSEIARHLTTPEQVMFVWLACGILTLFGAIVCAELASAFPQTGGVYVFLRETFSPLAGFLWGWAMFWSDALGDHRGDRDGVRALRGAICCVTLVASGHPTSLAVGGHRGVVGGQLPSACAPAAGCRPG